MDNIVAFFNHPFFIVVGGITTVVGIISIVTSIAITLYLVISGNLPVWYRIGMGLTRRKVGVFATNEYNSLKDLLADSKLFKLKNIIQVNADDIDKATNYDVFLVSWLDCKDFIEQIVSLKNDTTPLIVYAPHRKNREDKGRVPDDVMELINSKRNCVVVNFRGRLLNDILTSVITTSFEKRRI